MNDKSIKLRGLDFSRIRLELVKKSLRVLKLSERSNVVSHVQNVQYVKGKIRELQRTSPDERTLRPYTNPCKTRLDAFRLTKETSVLWCLSDRAASLTTRIITDESLFQQQ